MRGFATPPSSPARPLPPASQLTGRQEGAIEEERKEHHISQSQRRIGDIGTWQPAISHKCLPARPVPSGSTISSPTSSIDYRLTGVVIASVDVAVCLPDLPCVIPLNVMAVMYVGPLVCLWYQVNPLLMELLTGNTLK